MMFATRRQIKKLNINPAQYATMSKAGFRVTNFSSASERLAQWRRGDMHLVYNTRKNVNLKELIDFVFVSGWCGAKKEILSNIRSTTTAIDVKFKNN